MFSEFFWLSHHNSQAVRSAGLLTTLLTLDQPKETENYGVKKYPRNFCARLLRTLVGGGGVKIETGKNNSFKQAKNNFSRVTGKVFLVSNLHYICLSTI